MTPYVADPDFTLYLGDVRQVLANLPAGSVDCCVTSPPYWGLRDYGHEGQIGLEQTPDAYVSEMVSVFREVRRVLSESGSLWLNLGDSYAANRSYQVSDSKHQAHDFGGSNAQRVPDGLKPKDMVGIPWRVAFALQADGWYLRSDIVWSKPNPMPESVTDRPTKSHEYVFLLTKSPRYFFDADAIREPAEWARWGDQTNTKHEGSQSAAGWIGSRPKAELRSGRVGRYQERAMHGVGDGTTPRKTLDEPALTRNARSVWEIATQPYSEAHFATFPEELSRRSIAAGCPEQVCATCGKPRERIVERTKYEPSIAAEGERFVDASRGDKTRKLSGAAYNASVRVLGESWSDCGHDNYRRGIVIDPFMGSGTTALVARRLGRSSIGVELNPDYADLAARRLSQLSLLAEGAA